MNIPACTISRSTYTVAVRIRLCVVVNVEAGCVEMDRLTDVVVL